MINGAIWQFPVSLDIEANLKAIRRGLIAAEPETLLVMPEGAISGYEPAPNLIDRLDPSAINRAIEMVRSEVRAYKVHLVVGACLYDGEAWRNSSLYIRPDGVVRRYDKLNLAISERGSFKPGNELNVFPTRIASQDVVIGIQMCREIKYPEQWAGLARKGASIIAFLNNAVGDASIAQIWRSHLVSRAAETQRYVLAANNAAEDQKCPSMIIAPSGCILQELDTVSEQGTNCNFDLSSVSNWVLDQRRVDLFVEG